MTRLLAAFAALFVFGFSAHAGDADLGPAVGSTLPATTGEAINAHHGENGSVIFFIRSVDWCPYCKAQVIEISENHSAFADHGLAVIYVSYDDAEIQDRFVEKHNIEGVFLSDTDSTLIKEMGLLNESYKNEGRFYGVPHPAIFIISPENTINAKLFEDDWATNAKSYRGRPTVDAILSAADMDEM